MSEQKQYVGGAGRVTKPFEVRVTQSGRSVASCEVRLDGEGGWLDLVVWEPEAWFDGEWAEGVWLQQMPEGSHVGFYGVDGVREFTTKSGERKSRRTVTCYGIAPLWERPR